MVALPPRPAQVVINRIYAAIEKEAEHPEGIYLGRLGASTIGEECVRQIWLEWRAYAREEFDGRMRRLFNTGHLQEARIIEDLRRAGFAVWDKQEDGRQYEFTDETGHFVTKVDGVIKGVPESENKPHLLEVKTHNKNSFSALEKKGVAESKPLHYAQVQSGMEKLGTDRALYVAICKDDEKFYVERIKADKAEQQKLASKVTKLVEAKLKPAGISDDGSSFGCKFCGMRKVCIGEAAPLRTCRSCVHSSPGPEGSWVCNMQNVTLSLDAQKLTCEHYEVL